MFLPSVSGLLQRRLRYYGWLRSEQYERDWSLRRLRYHHCRQLVHFAESAALGLVVPANRCSKCPHSLDMDRNILAIPSYPHVLQSCIACVRNGVILGCQLPHYRCLSVASIYGKRCTEILFSVRFGYYSRGSISSLVRQETR